MSKRAIITIIILTLLIGAGILGFLMYSKNKTARPGEEVTLKDFFPFGSGGSDTGETNTGGDTENQQGNEASETGGGFDLSKLRELTAEPIAGAIIFNKEILKEIPTTPTPEDTFATEAPAPATKTPLKPETEIVPAVRYVDRATGHIFEILLNKQKEPRKISNTTIPRVHEALWGDNGKRVIFRYLNSANQTIESFLGVLPDEIIGGDSAGSQTLEGQFLPENIEQISVSPDTKKFFYLTAFGGGSAGTVATFDGSKKSQVFSSQLREWLPQWSSVSNIFLTTKPSSQIPGYTFSFNVEKNALNKVLGGIPGLTSLGSPDDKYILLAVSKGENISLYSQNIKSGKNLLLSTATLPEKCVFAKDFVNAYCFIPNYLPTGSYPDDWYQGNVSFSDSLWKINIETGFSEILVNPGDVLGKDIDAINPSIDPNEEYVLFMNKSTGLLYSYRLK